MCSGQKASQEASALRAEGIFMSTARLSISACCHRHGLRPSATDLPSPQVPLLCSRGRQHSGGCYVLAVRARGATGEKGEPSATFVPWTKPSRSHPAGLWSAGLRREHRGREVPAHTPPGSKGLMVALAGYAVIYFS